MSETPTAQSITDNSVRLAQITNPQSHIVHFNEKLPLDCGSGLKQFSIAYQTYGELNAAKSNLVLVCHALTGDQHVANLHPVTGKPGWWETMVGPGKPIDTNRYFVLCANVLGGCMGSTGPSSTNPATGNPYGPDFPVITVRDMVHAMGKVPVVFKQMVQGYVANRLQAAMGLEVQRMLDEGLVTPKDIDDSVIHGIALRMPILGVMAKADFTGLPLMQQGMANRSYTPPEVRGRSETLDKLIAEERTKLSGESDSVVSALTEYERLNTQHELAEKALASAST